jgi:short-subunit dehydrogenase
MAKPATPSVALITGASSGIGAALARELGRRGWAVGVVARRGDLLAQLVADLTTAGTRAHAVACDVADNEAVHEAVRQVEAALGPAELVVANAGISIPNHATKFKLAEAEQTIRVNVLGMMYLFDAVVPGMLERKRGHFVGVASVAGLRGLPTAAPYSASKAAMQNFLEASRVELAPYGIAVTTVNPGFVATDMTRKNQFRMPFLMQADDAAVVIADGLERRARVIEFPRPMSLLMRMARLVPAPLFDRMTAPYAKRKKV